MKTNTEVEELLRRYTKPSSDSEQARQDAAEQLVKDAIHGNRTLAAMGNQIEILPKGSYKNNTNVKLDSDVDIAVVSHQVFYPNYELLSEIDAARLKSAPPNGWLQPAGLRTALIQALAHEAGQSHVHPGRIAIQVDAVATRRTSADAVPSFEYRKYFYRTDGSIAYYEGNTVFPTSGPQIINWPKQQFEKGIKKNNQTGTRFKQLVRILKNLENDLCDQGVIRDMASYFIECLVYNVPDSAFGNTTLTADTRNVLTSIYNATKSGGSWEKWLEVNEMKWLFLSGQAWKPAEANELALAAWRYLDFS